MTRPADTPVGVGVIGANSFVANAAVLPAIAAASNASLIAAASRSGAVPGRWAHTGVGSYDDVIEHPDVDAIYVPLPNGMHEEWTARAAAAGKHVLCEKPLASDAATARRMAAACAEAGVLLAEAWMTPFSLRYGAALDTARRELGDLERVDARFTFTIDESQSANYRWDPDQGGGALLDVGIYCLGPAVELFGPDAAVARAGLRLTDRGVDAATRAELIWPNGATASIECSFVDDEAQTLEISGTDGRASVTTDAFTGGVDHPSFDLDRTGAGAQSIRLHDPNDPYRSMVEAFADAIRGRTEWPRPVERSIELLDLIERIRHAAVT